MVDGSARRYDEGKWDNREEYECRANEYELEADVVSICNQIVNKLQRWFDRRYQTAAISMLVYLKFNAGHSIADWLPINHL